MNTSGSVIGKSGKHLLKESSPFATLLLELSSSLADEEVSKFKLALAVDKCITKRELSSLKNAAEVMLYLHNHEYVSKTDTKFLEQLLIKCCRRDLVNKITKYHEKLHKKKDNEATSVKVCSGRETCGNMAGFTALKELKVNMSTNFETRSFRDGSSNMEDRLKLKQDCLQSSPMVVDENSQKNQKLSQMSISDDEKEKIGFKITIFDEDTIRLLSDLFK